MAGPVPLPDVKAWAAIHTQPRAEKVVADYLAKKRGTHYLPLTLNRKVYGARVRHSWIPLFQGYLFFDDGVTDRHLVCASEKIARSEITEPGTPVEVVSGPYLGTRGKLVRRKGATHLVLEVRFIGYGAALAIDASCVRPLDPDED